MKLEKDLRYWVGIAPALRELSEINLPVGPSFRIARFISKLQPEIKIYDEKRIELVKKYGTENDDKKGFTVSPENQKAFEDDYKLLLDEKVSIEFDVIPLEDLGAISISPKILTVLIDLFK